MANQPPDSSILFGRHRIGICYTLTSQDELELSGYPAYKILFRSLYPDDSPEPQYNIFLDNIKVVHL